MNAQENGLRTAFPCGEEETNGMSKREYFAALAMQGMASERADPGTVAELSVAFADSLLEELAFPQTPNEPTP